MLLATRESARWRTWVGGVAILATASYVAYSNAADFTHGGSAWGLAYGVATLLLVLLLTAFAARKRSYRGPLARAGRVETWLQSHVYLGLLTLLLALFHSGLRFEDDIAVAALAVLALVVGSGLFGAVLYTAVPRLLAEAEGELPPARAAAELDRLRRALERQAEGRSAAFGEVAGGLLAETRPHRLAGWRLLRTGAPAVSGAARRGNWRRGLDRVPADEEEALRRLLVLFRQHRELHRRLARRQRYKNLLEVWLWTHVPLTVVLLVLLALHVGAALFYRGLGWPQ